MIITPLIGSQPGPKPRPRLERAFQELGYGDPDGQALRPASEPSSGELAAPAAEQAPIPPFLQTTFGDPMSTGWIFNPGFGLSHCGDERVYSDQAALRRFREAVTEQVNAYLAKHDIAILVKDSDSEAWGEPMEYMAGTLHLENRGRSFALTAFREGREIANNQRGVSFYIVTCQEHALEGCENCPGPDSQ